MFKVGDKVVAVSPVDVDDYIIAGKEYKGIVKSAATLGDVYSESYGIEIKSDIEDCSYILFNPNHEGNVCAHLEDDDAVWDVKLDEEVCDES